MISRLARASLALWRREMLHFWRERSRVAGFAATPLLFWVVAGAGFGDMTRFYPGALLLSILFTAAFSAMPLIEERKTGFLLAVLASPAPRTAVLLGKMAGSASMALAQALLFAPALYFTGLRPGFGGALWALALAAGAGAGFGAAGFWLAWRSRTAQGFHAMINIALMPLWMISGALFPREGAYGWMAALMAANPLAYVHAGMVSALGGSAPGSAGMAVCAVAALGFGALSARALERDGARSMKP